MKGERDRIPELDGRKRKKKIKVAVDVETCSLAEIDEGHPN